MTKRQIFICLQNAYFIPWQLFLCCAIYKIVWFTKMGGFQSWILSLITYRYQFFLQQACHIDGSFLRCRAKKRSANMGRNTKVHFVVVLSISFGDHCVVYQSFCDVVCQQPSPYFLFDIFRLICMKIAKSDCIFQLPNQKRYYYRQNVGNDSQLVFSRSDSAQVSL